MRAMWRALLLAAVVAILSGCGGEQRLSATDYARQADAACASAFRAAPPRSAPLARRSANFFRLLARLRALRPPASEQATVDRWLATLLAVYKAGMREEKGDVAAASRERRLEARMLRLARALRLQTCAS
jgi:hypothetical protein